MATATAPAIPRRQLVSSTVVDGIRMHKTRWTSEDGKLIDDGWAYERLEPMPRAILDDRWAGMMGTHHDATKLQDRLDRVLTRLAEDLTRRELADSSVIAGEIVGLDIVMDIDGLEKVIRDWLLERAAKVAGL